MKLMSVVLLVLLFAAVARAADCRITVLNVQPPKDTNGNVISANCSLRLHLSQGDESADIYVPAYSDQPTMVYLVDDGDLAAWGFDTDLEIFVEPHVDQFAYATGGPGDPILQVSALGNQEGHYKSDFLWGGHALAWTVTE